MRGDTFGYLQRSFIGCVSDVDQREAREVGEKAVQYAFWGDRNGSVTIKRTGFYSVDYELAPLEAVAGKTRVMEDEFIAAAAPTSPTPSASICGRCWARACPTPSACAERSAKVLHKA